MPWIGLFVWVLGLVAPVLVRAQSEDEIKAAFLLNFARYVEWPENAFSSPESPVRICMLDSAGFQSVVSSTVAGKTVGPREVAVVDVASAGAASNCHILFIGSDNLAAQSIVGPLGGAAVFTVANDEGFAERGGVANFFRADNRIRFEINPNAAQSAGLKISSRLLRLAQLVE
jgi:hypothetical protein